MPFSPKVLSYDDIRQEAEEFLSEYHSSPEIPTPIEVGERFTLRNVRPLEDARIALGDRAEGAKLLLFGSSFEEAVQASAGERADLEIVDLERLYEGA